MESWSIGSSCLTDEVQPRGYGQPISDPGTRPRLLFVINESYFLISHRLELIHAATKRFEVHVAAPSDHVWAPPGFEVSALEAVGVTFHPIRLSRRGQRPAQELATLFDLFWQFRRLAPDVVHTLTIKPVIYGGLLARLFGIRVVVSITGLGQVFVASGIWGAIRKRVVLWLMRLACRGPRSFVICQTDHDRDSLATWGVVDLARSVVVGGAGVALDDFSPRPQREGTPIAIFAGRLLWEKGVGEFVDAVRCLRSRGAVGRFVLVGGTRPSNPDSVPSSQIEGWVRDGLIEWWGHRTDMPKVLGDAHVVCLPTRYGEGVPKILIEAAAAGRPIVASDLPGCREVVKNERNGLIVPPGDVRSLVSAIERLMTDSELRRRYGDEGRRIAEQRFDVEKVVSATLTVYDDMLKLGSARQSPSK